MTHIKQPQQLLLGTVLTLFLGTPAFAAEVTGLTTFTTGTPALAAEVNGNFSTVATAVNDNNARIAALETKNAALEAKITALQAKLASVSVQTVNGQPTVRFTGVNVQVVNGQGSTTTANGTGNLIVGYDEADVSLINHCTIGTNPTNSTIVTDPATCTAAGGTWTNTGFKTGSHYIVAGSENNYSRWGGVVFGFRNTSNYDYASVSGGVRNTAGGTYASVSGGWANTASGTYASVSGGGSNTASGIRSGVSGGYVNTASGSSASVSGGMNNTASGSYASVSGGGDVTVAGGNMADTNFSSILGGMGQDTSSASQTIPALP